MCHCEQSREGDWIDEMVIFAILHDREDKAAVVRDRTSQFASPETGLRRVDAVFAATEFGWQKIPRRKALKFS